MIIPYSRKLESIVPKEDKKIFSLYHEDDQPNFSLSASPKPNAPAGESADTAMPESEPLATSPEKTDAPPAEGDDKTKDQSTWLVKKLVGLLRYCGAMAVELRGAMPDEANEIIEQIQDQLESIASSLDPFVTNKTEEPEPEPEEQPEPEDTEQPPQESKQGKEQEEPVV